MIVGVISWINWIKWIRSKIALDRYSHTTKMEQMMGPLLAEMKATRVNQEEMKVTIKARQEQMTTKMPTNREEMKAMMEAWLEKIKASQEKLEANQDTTEHAEAHTFLPPSTRAVVVCGV